jgi:hypothetical protein
VSPGDLSGGGGELSPVPEAGQLPVGELAVRLRQPRIALSLQQLPQGSTYEITGGAPDHLGERIVGVDHDAVECADRDAYS